MQIVLAEAEAMRGRALVEEVGHLRVHSIAFDEKGTENARCGRLQGDGSLRQSVFDSLYRFRFRIRLHFCIRIC